MPFLHKYLGNPVLSFLGRLFFKIPVGDFHCGLRGFRRDRMLALGLRAKGMEFASEMVVRAALSELAIIEVPTTLSPDGRSRRPHLRTWRDGWRHLKFLLMLSPRWLFFYPVQFCLAWACCAGRDIRGSTGTGSRCARHPHDALRRRGDDHRPADGDLFCVREDGRGCARRVAIGKQLQGLRLALQPRKRHRPRRWSCPRWPRPGGLLALDLGRERFSALEPRDIMRSSFRR